MENIVEGVAIMGIYLCPLLFLLVLGGVFSDYILPRCPRLTRFLERTLDVDLEGDDYE